MSVLHALIEIIFIFDLLIWFENSIRAIIIMAMMMMMMTDRNWILFISLNQAFSVVKHEWNEMENDIKIPIEICQIWSFPFIFHT